MAGVAIRTALDYHDFCRGGRVEVVGGDLGDNIYVVYRALQLVCVYIHIVTSKS